MRSLFGVHRLCGALCGVVVALLCLTGSAFAQAQATTAVIQGEVTDGTGAIVPGAKISAKSVETGLERNVTSNEDGIYRIPLLPVGTYKVTAEANGFSTLVVENINLTVGQTFTQNLSLKPGGASEIINVQAEAVVETGRVEQSTLINQKSVEELPISRRDFTNFIGLTPGVSIVQGPDGDVATLYGQRGTQNNLSIDGADANNPFFGEQRGGQRPAFTIGLESVKEFQVVPIGASAEFGRSSGGFINVITKSGTNDYRGTAYLYFRNQALASQNPDAVKANLPTEDFKNYQFGGNFGGPIKKDTAFFFISYDQQSGRSEKPNSIDPRLVQLFATRFNSPGEQGIIKRTNDANVLLGKVDWAITPSNLLTLRHNYSRANLKNGTFDVPTWGTSANGRETDNSNAFIAQLVSSLSATKVNEFRFQYAREARPRFYDGPDLPDTTIGTFDGKLSYRFGRPFFLPVPEVDKRIQFNDNFSIITGRHSFKFGVEYNRTTTSQTFVGFARGRYIFAGPTIDAAIKGFTDYIDRKSAAGLSLYLQFAPLGGRTIEEAGFQEFSVNEPGLFAQDAWKIRNNITFNYGLRWEAQLMPNPINSPQNTAFGQFLSNPLFPSDGKIPDFTDGWQPRVGLAWDPFSNGKTVVRLGAGIYYARLPGLPLAGPRNTDGAIAGNIFFAGFLGLPISAYPQYPGIVSTQGFRPFNPGIAIFPRNFEYPRTVQYAASIEHEIVKDTTVSLALNYAHATRQYRFVNRGNPQLYGGASPFSKADGSGIGEIRSIESSAKSLFRGITFGVNKRFSNRIQVQANYVLSWDYSDDDNERDPFTFRYADIQNLSLEYSLSDRDQRHRVNIFSTFEGPYGIKFSAIFQSRSAQPVSDPSCARSDSDCPGTTIRRNGRHQDNVFTTLDFRVLKTFKFTDTMALDGILEVFNIANSRNLRFVPRPLTFNFDGTVRQGFGDPRQVQLGVRFRF
ncbi:MAG: carboxypeptidase regulatory-like domain-containing protein [Blastocatellia bacterium]|nr:carboxypeptidase regulatory-like domain-containing protein [Blastocatellia bacterium]